MDIAKADKLKVEFRVMLWYLKRHMKKHYKITLEEMENDLNNCGNNAISEIWNILNNTSNKITQGYQKDIVKEFSMALLWILYRDTAYLPITMHVLKEFYDKKDKILPAVDKYYVDPKEWYVNAWNDTLKHTRELKDEGTIPDMDGVLSYDEKIFVPMMQEAEWKKLSKDMDKEFALKRQRKNYGRDEDVTTEKKE